MALARLGAGQGVLKKTTDKPEALSPVQQDILLQEKSLRAAQDYAQGTTTSAQVQDVVPSARSKRTQEWGATSNSTVNTDAFTPEEYSQLSEKQRRLVDAQTELWSAVQGDKTANKTLSEGERTTSIADPSYSAAMTKLFSAEGGSDIYAPRTVAALSALNMGDELNDIDQYLRGNAFLTKEQVLSMGGEAPLATAGRPEQNAWLTVENSTSTGIADILKQGQSILAGIQGDPAYSYANGLAPAKETSPLDTLKSDQLVALDSLMQGMSLQEEPEDVSNYYDSVQKDFGLTPDLINSYVSKKLNEWETGAMTVGEGYISPEEFRARWKMG